MYVITSNSNGDPQRRASLLNLLGVGATEEILDPGTCEVVRARLAVDGVLSPSMRRCDRPLVWSVVMENLLCEVRFAEDPSRLSPGRLTGTLVTYEVRAKDRPELFARGALTLATVRDRD